MESLEDLKHVFLAVLRVTCIPIAMRSRVLHVFAFVGASESCEDVLSVVAPTNLSARMLRKTHLLIMKSTLQNIAYPVDESKESVQVVKKCL